MESFRILRPPQRESMYLANLKNLGLVIGRAKMNIFTMRAKELIDGNAALIASTEPLFKVRETIASIARF